MEATNGLDVDVVIVLLVCLDQGAGLAQMERNCLRSLLRRSG